MARVNGKKTLFAIGKALGRSNKSLANELNISEKTASVWGRDPVILEKIHALQVENWLQSQALLVALQTKAIDTLSRLLQSENEAIKLKSASILLNLCSSFPSYF